MEKESKIKATIKEIEEIYDIEEYDKKEIVKEEVGDHISFEEFSEVTDKKQHEEWNKEDA